MRAPLRECARGVRDAAIASSMMPRALRYAAMPRYERRQLRLIRYEALIMLMLFAMMLPFCLMLQRCRHAAAVITPMLS